MAHQKQSSAGILVVGGGPTGLLMASELLRHGVSCRVVDENADPSPLSRAIGIHARTMELFDDLGIASEVLSRGQKIHGLNMYAGAERIAHISFDELDAPYPFILSLPQYETE